MSNKYSARNRQMSAAESDLLFKQKLHLLSVRWMLYVNSTVGRGLVAHATRFDEYIKTIIIPVSDGWMEIETGGIYFPQPPAPTRWTRSIAWHECERSYLIVLDGIEKVHHQWKHFFQNL